MTKDYLIYLAGPISGLSFAGATDWRQHASIELQKRSVALIGVSPMRAKDYLAAERSIGHSYEDTILSGAKAITTRDRFDVRRADVVLMNLLGATKVSIGTMIEAGWADAFRVPVVLVIEPENAHQHPMLQQVAGWVVGSLDEAVATVAAVLLPR